jgi:hypothetical protein
MDCRFATFHPGARAASQHAPAPVARHQVGAYVKEQPAIAIIAQPRQTIGFTVKPILNYFFPRKPLCQRHKGKLCGNAVSGFAQKQHPS